ncbi:MAG: hypothetical protein ABI616_14990 [Pseudomonadota bacterium]
MRSEPLAYGSLFVASFAVTLVIAIPGGISWRDAAPGTHVLPGLVAAGPSTAIHGRVDSSADGDFPDEDESLNAAQISATTSLDVDERIHAIQVLGEAPDDKALDTLVAISTNGFDPLERASAITALRRLQRNGSDPRIGNALQVAAMDPDPMVVVLAQSALEGPGADASQ